MIKQFVKFLKDEDGVTSVEYAVMAALIALVVIGSDRRCYDFGQ
jgi:Flp pilus assembly pilin Flp